MTVRCSPFSNELMIMLGLRFHLSGSWFACLLVSMILQKNTRDTRYQQNLVERSGKAHYNLEWMRLKGPDPGILI